MFLTLIDNVIVPILQDKQDVLLKFYDLRSISLQEMFGKPCFRVSRIVFLILSKRKKNCR